MLSYIMGKYFSMPICAYGHYGLDLVRDQSASTWSVARVKLGSY